MVGAPFAAAKCMDEQTGVLSDEPDALCSGMNSGLALWNVPTMRRVDVRVLVRFRVKSGTPFPH